jgi:hypothetical protein
MTIVDLMLVDIMVRFIKKIKLMITFNTGIENASNLFFLD